MGTLRKESFTPLTDQTFVICLDNDRKIPLKLASITSRNLSDQFESFTLNFDPLDGTAALPDGNYVLENEQLGRATIYISPTPDVGPTPGRFYYEAVFNVYIGGGE